MSDKPSTPRFSLRALFVLVAFMGLGLLAIRYSNAVALDAVRAMTGILYASAAAIALLTEGSRRPFWAAFAITAIILTWLSEPYIPHSTTNYLWPIFHPDHPLPDPASSYRIDTPEPNPQLFGVIVWRLSVVLISTAAAYIIPWFVHREKF